jgi:glycosyltransferase XagB
MLREIGAIGYDAAQIIYFLGFVVIFYFLTRPINWVDSSKVSPVAADRLPYFVLAYPVLRENAATMSSTLVSLGWTEYPRDRFTVIAIPNSNDLATIAELRRLQGQFPFLKIMEVPPTSDPSWEAVWRAWSSNTKAYWFHHGRTRGSHDLPPKKTRQLIYLFYRLVEEMGTDWVLDYIDADSMPPPNHFRIAAEGLRHYDVLQSLNVAGNLLDSMPASLHALDHMCWDALLYPHMSANGRHPYYVLGKGLFYRARDLLDVGGFNPWITIEDPEVGMRLWTNGKRLGIIAEPLIEEVPRTLVRGIIQRNRWVCGFFQSLSQPLSLMGMPFWRRLQARLNIVPVLSVPVNVIGLPTGALALYNATLAGGNHFPFWLASLSIINIGLYILVMCIIYLNAWHYTALVLDSKIKRVWYLVRVNPLFVFIYYLIWTIPICIGFLMFLGDRGKAWARTEKFDANHEFAEKGPNIRPADGSAPR